MDLCNGITDGSHDPPAGGEKSDYLMLSSKNIFDDQVTMVHLTTMLFHHQRQKMMFSINWFMVIFYLHVWGQQ